MAEVEEGAEEYQFGLPQDEVEIEPAPILKRTFAYLIDLAIFYFIFFQIFMMIYINITGIPAAGSIGMFEAYIAENAEAATKVFTGFVGSLFVFLFYFMVTEKVLGASMGKHFLKLKVVALNNREITYWQAFVRNITKTVLFPFLVFDILGIFWTANKQRLSEMLAGTKVIYSGMLELVYEVFE